MFFFYSGGCASQKENSWIKVCQDQDNKKHFVLLRIFKTSKSSLPLENKTRLRNCVGNEWPWFSSEMS